MWYTVRNRHVFTNWLTRNVDGVEFPYQLREDDGDLLERGEGATGVRVGFSIEVLSAGLCEADRSCSSDNFPDGCGKGKSEDTLS